MITLKASALPAASRSMTEACDRLNTLVGDHLDPMGLGRTIDALEVDHPSIDWFTPEGDLTMDALVLLTKTVMEETGRMATTEAADDGA